MDGQTYKRPTPYGQVVNSEKSTSNKHSYYPVMDTSKSTSTEWGKSKSRHAYTTMRLKTTMTSDGKENAPP